MKAWLGGYQEFENPNKEEYNSIPVHYCKDCLSLKINGEIDGCDYCENCNGTSINQCSIQEWEQLFENKYGYSFLNGKPESKYIKLINKLSNK